MLTPEQLITLMTESSWGVPVKDMETLIEHGSGAVECLVSFLEGQDLQTPSDVELLWPVVVLGELKSPEGVPALLRILKEAPGLEPAVAAAEGLSKVGKAALEAVERAMDGDPNQRARILCYAALSGMNLPEAWEILEEDLEVGGELDFAAARALSERNLPEDLERVHQAYLRAEPWTRSAFEETLRGMISGRLPWVADYHDWRLRYRRQPRQGLQIPLTWPSVMFLMWESRHELRPPPEASTLSLDQLRKEARVRHEARRCEDCGRPLRSPTGVPLCEEVEADLVAYQLGRIQNWRADGWEDIHETLDELDRQDMDVLQWPEATEEDRARKGEALDAIDVVKRTLCWMVEQGLKDVSQGERRLAAALRQAGSKGR